ncbi:MAG: transposase [Ignavibacteriaceae bacterium]|nr:transposase [Ignavibacteriaceae bacterium]
MSHSLTKIWIHGVFSTKDHLPLIHESFEKQAYSHIKEHLEKELDCKVRVINGTENHIHILFLLSSNYSVSEIFKSIKGEFSHWCNQMNFTEEKFVWQIGYGAFSVSESQVNDVEKYIINQKNIIRRLAIQKKLSYLLRDTD